MENKTSTVWLKIACIKGIKDMGYPLKDKDLKYLRKIHDFAVLLKNTSPTNSKTNKNE